VWIILKYLLPILGLSRYIENIKLWTIRGRIARKYYWGRCGDEFSIILSLSITPNLILCSDYRILMLRCLMAISRPTNNCKLTIMQHKKVLPAKRARVASGSAPGRDMHEVNCLFLTCAW
jgi:hypothetical protein